MNQTPPTDDRAALDILELIPLIMQAIRREMRSASAPELSVPQFRTLAFLGRHEGTSLSAVAEHIGLMLPAASRVVDELVLKKLASREVAPDDRRRISLKLTTRGRRKLDATRQLAREALTARLTGLRPSERADLQAGLLVLRRVFTEAHPGTDGIPG